MFSGLVFLSDCLYGFPAGIKYPIPIAVTARHAAPSIIASPMVVINVTFGGPSSRTKIRLKLNPKATSAPPTPNTTSPEISHDFPREFSAEHHALPQRTIICASRAHFFASDMSSFILNMKTHVSCEITGRINSSQIKLIARIIFHCKSATGFERK
jgi:hypothetical protein